MNRLKTTFTVALLLPLLLLSACKRRPIEDNEEMPLMARIPVRIDWSDSGINPSSQNAADEVYRVSIRFFPEDGSPAFDRYIAGNVVTGWVSVPIGRYSVVVFNESVYDADYWSGAIAFTDVDSYANFAAHAVAADPVQCAAEYPFYTPQPGESVVIGSASPKLASWSLDEFEVTESVLLLSNGLQPPGGVEATDRAMLEALTHIEMHRLTRTVNVTARVTNLVSIRTNYCSLNGLANTVYMASRENAQTSSTCLFQLNGRQYDSDQKSGTTRRSFLSFGSVTPPQSTLGVDIIYITGELKPRLAFNVTSQMGAAPDIHINVNYSVDYKGGIAVNDWEDEVHELK